MFVLMDRPARAPAYTLSRRGSRYDLMFVLLLIIGCTTRGPTKQLRYALGGSLSELFTPDYFKDIWKSLDTDTDIEYLSCRWCEVQRCFARLDKLIIRFVVRGDNVRENNIRVS